MNFPPSVLSATTGMRLKLAGCAALLCMLGVRAWSEEPRQPLVLLGKSYPQYQQVSSAFTQEWKAATGTEPKLVGFPSDETQQRQLLNGQPPLVVALGEGPTNWCLHQQGAFQLAFTMVVQPERMKDASEQSPVRSRKVTAVSIDVPVQEQVKVLLSVMPRLKRVGVVTCDHGLRESVAELRRVCESNHLQLIHVELSSVSELPSKLTQLLAQIDLLWSMPDAEVFQPELARHIIRQCTERSVPLLGLSSTFVKTGATISFERDYSEVGRLLARSALERLAQTDSGPLWQLESPQRIIVIINQRSSETLGLKKEINLPQVSVTLY